MDSYPIGIGTWPLGGRAYGPVLETAARAAIRTASDLGCRLFDTAGIYGDGIAERLLGDEADRDARIVTKAGYVSEVGNEQDFSDRSVRLAIEATLERLQRPAVSTVLMHSPPAEVIRDRRVQQTFARLVTDGLAERVGVSVRSFRDVDAALSWDEATCVEVIFNVFDQRILDDDVIAACRLRECEVLARLPLCGGYLVRGGWKKEPIGTNDTRARWPDEVRDRWRRASRRVERAIADGDVMAAALAFLRSWDGVVPIVGVKSSVQARQVVAAARSERDPNEVEVLREMWRNEFSDLPPI